MKSLALTPLLLSLVSCGVVQRRQSEPPTAVDSANNVTYQGLYRSNVEAFLGIQYGQDTGGENRFKRPAAYSYQNGSVVTAQNYGPACPQPLGDKPYPIYLSNITEISENCLLLNVKRPNGTTSDSKLPVMVFIHGDSFIGASKDEIVSEASGLVLQSVLNGNPVMHVSMNYRLGVFGFSYTEALQQEGSTNGGLRDQRLAIEWVQNNIAAFGGDPEKITIFGQSSGGLAVGLQILAYGGSKPVPFQQAICQSQAMEAGITGNFTRDSMNRMLGASSCNTTDRDSEETITCLRNLTLDALLDAQVETYSNAPWANIGDEWLPVVDGDFIPEAPSSLIREGKFANVTTMIGWTDGDLDIIIPTNVSTAADSDAYVRQFLPGFNETSIQTLESLYPVTDFSPNEAANLTAEFYRTSRILRDIVMVCMATWYGEHISAQGNKVYYYDQNQTFLNPLISSVGLPNLGVYHTSEFAYVFGNLSNYDVWNFPFLPNDTDYQLLERESRSWSSFAATGSPSIQGNVTLQGWETAYAQSSNGSSLDIFVIGGQDEGLAAWSDGDNDALNGQKLVERCAFLNAPEIIQQLGF